MGAWISTATTPSSPPWLSLPPELVNHILSHLPSHIDRVRFAAVCRLWRHVATHPSAPPPLPWLALRDDGARLQLQSLPDGELYTIQEKEHEAVHGGTTGPLYRWVFGRWLLLEVSKGHPWAGYFLRNPLTRDTVRLPGRCNKPVGVNPDDGGLLPATSASSSDIWNSGSTLFGISKIIVRSSDDDDDDLIIAMISYSYQQHIIACWRPGMASWSTGLLNSNIRYIHYMDMAIYKGSIYTVTAKGDLYAHEISKHSDILEPRVCRLTRAIQVKDTLGRSSSYTWVNSNRAALYLVSSCTGKLMLVQRIVHKNYYHAGKDAKAFRVFEADFENSQWLEMESIGEQVFFISQNCSRAIWASDGGKYHQASTIYFLHDDKYNSYVNSLICGMYNMSTKAICPISVGDLHVSGVMNAAWFFP